jgi:tRNA(fMet)-specific endonuclease VapC
MIYLLDTNACIGVINKKPEVVRERMLRIDPENIFISQVVLYELLFGVCHSNQIERNKKNLNHFLKYIQVLDWGEEQARVASKIRCYLSQKGQLIGPYDILIAAHAVSLKACLVTHNTKEFERVSGLTLEDWESETS